jgi:hypothetical protein
MRYPVAARKQAYVDRTDSRPHTVLPQKIGNTQEFTLYQITMFRLRRAQNLSTSSNAYFKPLSPIIPSATLVQLPNIPPIRAQ